MNNNIKSIHFPVINRWFVAYTLSSDVFHWGEVGQFQEMVTGQETLERFGNESALAARINTLKGVANWYEDNINSDF